MSAVHKGTSELVAHVRSVVARSPSDGHSRRSRPPLLLFGQAGKQLCDCRSATNLNSEDCTRISR